jgi:hypothetical protein
MPTHKAPRRRVTNGVAVTPVAATVPAIAGTAADNDAAELRAGQ